jgi:hypothetical protein
LANQIDYWYENKEELRGAEMKKKVLAEADWYRFDRAVNEYEAFIKEIVNPSIKPKTARLKPKTVTVKS